MKEYTKGKFIAFATVNTIMTLLSITVLYLSFGLARAFTPSDQIAETMKNFFIILIIVLLVDGMKWLAFYFIMKKGYKKWYAYYVFYLIIFGFFAIYAPIVLIIPFIYFITFIYVDKDLLFKYK